jgi:electron transport complex protein RnfB
MADVYVRLREFLDKLPAGYPSTPTGVELKILQKLFTPEEAELTMQLRNEPEEVSAIARRVGMDEKQLAQKLEDMAQKGILFRIRSGDKSLYQAFQFVVGVYEFQLKRLDKEFCELFEEYLPYLGANMMSVPTRQLRVVPVESAVGSGKGVASYNQVRQLVERQRVFAVQECICRKEQALLGHGCEYPREICLGFGDFAQFYIDNHMAKQITKEECLRLLDKAEKAGLVLSPTNTQDVAAICCCCSCCCPVLKFAKMAPRPADLVLSYYESKIDPDLCTGCGDCIQRCPMDAIREGDQVSEVIEGRCIGCGLCVSVCPVEAISLVAKAGLDAPPKDMTDMMSRIAAERGVA